LTLAGENLGIIKAEILNLDEQKKGTDFNFNDLEKSLTKLYYRRAGLITNLNIVFAQTKEKNIPEVIKKHLIEKASLIKNDLVNAQYQIDAIQERIRSSRFSEYSLNNQINIRKKILNYITGSIVAKSQSEVSSQINKELGRIKG